MELELDDNWRERRTFDAVMRFDNAGLVLGFGTVLSNAGASPRDISINVSESRFLTLLAAAHLRPPTSLGLAHIRKSAESWREGRDVLASIHLALSGLDRLKRPVSDARRLFFADHLLNGGLPAETIIKALDMGAPENGVRKYSPDQPRVPAGSGRPSGEWTTGADPSGNEPSPSPLGSDQNRDLDKRKFTVRLPAAIECARVPIPTTPFTEAVKALGDAIEVADSISKWRELGPKGEAAIVAAVQAKGWIVLGTQVRVQAPGLGLRVEDVMVRVPPGTAGNARAYDGFIEVKVNGGRYSEMQQMKDTAIYTRGGILLSPVKADDYAIGEKLFLGTGLANVTITYEPKE